MKFFVEILQEFKSGEETKSSHLSEACCALNWAKSKSKWGDIDMPCSSESSWAHERDESWR